MLFRSNLESPASDEPVIAAQLAAEEVIPGVELDDDLSLEEQLEALLVEHRKLDDYISELQTFPYQDQLEIQRLKKKKLHIKDAITYIKDQIIPDWNA